MSDDQRAGEGAEQPVVPTPEGTAPLAQEPDVYDPPPMADPAETPWPDPQLTNEPPAYDPNVYRQPSYGQPNYSQPSYDQQQYAGQYGQNPYAPYPPEQYQQQPKPRISAGTVVLAVIAALVMGSIAGFAGGFLGGQASRGVTALTGGIGNQKVTVIPSTTDEPVVAAAAAAVPSVVNIDITGDTTGGGQQGLPESHPNVPNGGTGSGVAYKKVEGGGTYILTNNHVVEGAKRLTVSDSRGKTYSATLVGRDPDTDVAVVRISGELPTIDIGDSTKLLVGQTVVAIGSPYGFQHSVTSGVVSATGRLLNNVVGESGPSASSLSDVIQTDAAINPGNSGGALIDRAGKLVGINTAIYSSSGQSGGIGFAIPVATVVRVADELIAGGKVGHPFIGLVGSTVNEQVAADKKLPVKQGAYVESLASDGGAAKAGIKVGDVVTQVGGQDILSMDDLVLQVRRHSIGETIKLTVKRGDQTLTFDVKVGDKPADFKLPSQDTSGGAK